MKNINWSKWIAIALSIFILTQFIQVSFLAARQVGGGQANAGTDASRGSIAEELYEGVLQKAGESNGLILDVRAEEEPEPSGTQTEETTGGDSVHSTDAEDENSEESADTDENAADASGKEDDGNVETVDSEAVSTPEENGEAAAAQSATTEDTDVTGSTEISADSSVENSVDSDSTTETLSSEGEDETDTLSTETSAEATVEVAISGAEISEKAIDLTGKEDPDSLTWTAKVEITKAADSSNISMAEEKTITITFPAGLSVSGTGGDLEVKKNGGDEKQKIGNVAFSENKNTVTIHLSAIRDTDAITSLEAADIPMTVTLNKSAISAENTVSVSGGVDYTVTWPASEVTLGLKYDSTTYADGQTIDLSTKTLNDTLSFDITVSATNGALTAGSKDVVFPAYFDLTDATVSGSVAGIGNAQGTRNNNTIKITYEAGTVSGTSPTGTITVSGVKLNNENLPATTGDGAEKIVVDGTTQITVKLPKKVAASVVTEESVALDGKTVTGKVDLTGKRPFDEFQLDLTVKASAGLLPETPAETTIALPTEFDLANVTAESGTIAGIGTYSLNKNENKLTVKVGDGVADKQLTEDRTGTISLSGLKLSNEQLSASAKETSFTVFGTSLSFSLPAKAASATITLLVQDDSETPVKLDGAEFSIQRSDTEKGTYVAYGDALRIADKDNGVSAELFDGYYKITQNSAKTGYEKLTDPIALSVSNGKVTSEEAGTGWVYDGKKLVYTITNPSVERSVSVKFIVQDDSETPKKLDEATFSLVRKEREADEYPATGSDEVKIAATTGAYKSLGDGFYRLTQKAAKTGHDPLEASIEFRVADGVVAVKKADGTYDETVKSGTGWTYDDTAKTFTITNPVSKAEEKAVISIQLVDAEGNRISGAGAAFELRVKSDAVDGKVQLTKADIEVMVSDSGVITAADMEDGDYYLREVTAPSGYKEQQSSWKSANYKIEIENGKTTYLTEKPWVGTATEGKLSYEKEDGVTVDFMLQGMIPGNAATAKALADTVTATGKFSDGSASQVLTFGTDGKASASKFVKGETYTLNYAGTTTIPALAAASYTFTLGADGTVTAVTPGDTTKIYATNKGDSTTGTGSVRTSTTLTDPLINLLVNYTQLTLTMDICTAEQGYFSESEETAETRQAAGFAFTLYANSTMNSSAIVKGALDASGNPVTDGKTVTANDGTFRYYGLTDGSYYLQCTTTSEVSDAKQVDLEKSAKSIFQVAVENGAMKTLQKTNSTKGTWKVVNGRIRAYLQQGSLKLPTSTKKFYLYRLNHNGNINDQRGENKLKGLTISSEDINTNAFKVVDAGALLKSRLNDLDSWFVLKAKAAESIKTIQRGDYQWQLIGGPKSGGDSFNGLIVGQYYVIREGDKEEPSDSDAYYLAKITSTTAKTISSAASTTASTGTKTTTGTTTTGSGTGTGSSKSTVSGNSTASKGSGGAAGARSSNTGDGNALWMHLIIMLIAFDALVADLLYISRKKQVVRSR